MEWYKWLSGGRVSMDEKVLEQYRKDHATVDGLIERVQRWESDSLAQYNKFKDSLVEHVDLYLTMKMDEFYKALADGNPDKIKEIRAAVKLMIEGANLPVIPKNMKKIMEEL
jgi:hypothetical protein